MRRQTLLAACVLSLTVAGLLTTVSAAQSRTTQTTSPRPATPQATAPATPASRSQAPPATSKPTPSPAERAEANATLDRIYGPLLVWHPDQKDPRNVLKADMKFLNNDPRKRPAGSQRKAADAVSVEAVCAPNGASVNVKLLSDSGTQGPQFDWHDDPTAPGEGIVDVKVTTDGASHVAKGFLVKEGDDQYVNHMGLLFYEPGVPIRARRETEFGLRTGTPLDNIVGGLLDSSEKSQADEGVRTSAGPLRDLVNARSITMQFPVREGNYSATLELNPQDAVLHDFATRCYERFVTTKAPAAPATTPSTPSRQAPPAGSTPARRTR